MLAPILLAVVVLLLVVAIVLEFVGVNRMQKGDYKDAAAAIYSAVAFGILGIILAIVAAFAGSPQGQQIENEALLAAL